MPLARLLEDYFSPESRAQGDALDAKGKTAINVFEHWGSGLDAEVGDGGTWYEVTLQSEGTKKGLEGGCTCEEGQMSTPCAHVWALLRTLDHRRDTLETSPVGPLDLRLCFEEFFEPADHLHAPHGDEDDDPENLNPFLRPTVVNPLTGLLENLQSFYPKSPQAVPKKDGWRDTLKRVAAFTSWRRTARIVLKPRQVWYVINPHVSVSENRLTIDLCQREVQKNGKLGKFKDLRLEEPEVATWPEEEHRELLAMLQGGGAFDAREYFGHHRETRFSRCMVSPALYSVLLPRLCGSLRFGMPRREGPEAVPPEPLVWDDGPPWKFALKIEKGAKNVWQIRGAIMRGEESLDLCDVQLCILEGLAVVSGKLARLSAEGADGWIKLLMSQGSIEVPEAQQEALLEQLWQMPELPELILPEELNYEQVHLSVVPQLNVKASQTGKANLDGKVVWQYGEHSIVRKSAQATVSLDQENRRIFLRDKSGEQAAYARLDALGLKPISDYDPDWDVRFPAKDLAAVVRELTSAGWRIEAEGKLIRRAGTVKLSVKSSVDWFELNGLVDFDGATVALPELLAALRNGQQFVALGDGTQGMLPEEWLNKYGGLAALGEAKGEALRFVPSQALILDALLAAQPEADVDATFERVRQRLQSFAGMSAVHEPGTFVGELRPYQREGLGWLLFLREFGFGGCLADDMGLGKTIQVLAMLEARRTEKIPKKDRLPSLVVVPRSLVHNWIEEAARFTPALRVLDFSGLKRGQSKEELAKYDVVISTYGTLLRDIVDLREMQFDYAILDESQAIKNSSSQSAKAVRLIQARHRLAMTGTPIENHLGELWSLFEFLNPGMLGRSEALKAFSAKTRPADKGSLELLAQALRPFLLRRTKDKVLEELPEKTEQTLYCELDKKQRKLYDDLKKHYQKQLADKIAADGLNRSKIQVLEALLRLRQAACHPGLLDVAKAGESSAKLETLLEQLREVLAEGHKALVFSQFTSLLALVKKELDREKLVYEYLDGQTRDRKARVERFQSDPDCPLFLISLKAGGLGLNLTAADYVFILDPWWNPAVEAQAVDRAHRIGQTKRVFAYRLIARDTVEEKILELQRGKRELAEAIISADNSVLASLSADDLALLLS